MRCEPLDYASPRAPRRPWCDWGLLSFAVPFAMLAVAVGAAVLVASGHGPWPALSLLVPINPVVGVILGVAGLRVARGGDSGAAGPGLVLNGLLLLPLAGVACWLIVNRVLG